MVLIKINIEKKIKDKKMKKVLLGLGLAAVLGASVASARGVDLFVSDMEYYWDVNKKTCEKTSFNAKKLVMRAYQDDIIIINKQYVNDAGRWTWLEGEMDGGKMYSMHMFTTYGECKAFEKAVINDQKIDNWSYFANLKDPAENIKK